MKPLVFAASQDDTKEADCRSPGRRHAHSFVRDRTSRMNPLEIDEFKYPKLYPYGPCVAAERLVWAVARVFEVDPKTVLQWLVEAADQAMAFSQYFLHDVRVSQVQLGELFALVSVVKAGAISDAEAILRFSRSPHWVWAAIAPVRKLLLSMDIGGRTRAVAKYLVYQVVEVLALGCVPRFLTDGFKPIFRTASVILLNIQR
jgi:hypothetical protein